MCYLVAPHDWRHDLTVSQWELFDHALAKMSTKDVTDNAFGGEQSITATTSQQSLIARLRVDREYVTHRAQDPHSRTRVQAVTDDLRHLTTHGKQIVGNKCFSLFRNVLVFITKKKKNKQTNKQTKQNKGRAMRFLAACMLRDVLDDCESSTIATTHLVQTFEE